jgi:Fic family protein
MTINQNRLGTYLRCTAGGEVYQAFLPQDLPPNPPVNMPVLQELLAKAHQALGRLDAVCEFLPENNLLLYYYVRKEAVLSSQIEGTQSSLADLLLYESEEAPSVPLDDVAEVSNYVAALEHGLKRVREGFPLSLRLIREMHAILLAKGRGSHKLPGEFRTSQNWIGGSRPGNAVFVPPPPEKLLDCLGALEKYLHEETSHHGSLIDAGLIHVQFETIHPFLDGNGRLGRLLITFFLMMRGDLREPNLYLSLFFKNNQQEYYRRLNAVRVSGDWEGWLDFFLHGIAVTANQVVETSQAISHLFQANHEKITTLKRASHTAHLVHKELQKKALSNAISMAATLNISVPTARVALNNLVGLGIVTDISGSGKERIYIYQELIDVLERGAEPISV